MCNLCPQRALRIGGSNLVLADAMGDVVVFEKALQVPIRGAVTGSRIHQAPVAVAARLAPRVRSWASKDVTQLVAPALPPTMILDLEQEALQPG